MKRKVLFSTLIFITSVITGCKSQQRAETPYDNPLLPGQSALRKITDPYEIPDFTMACFDLANLRTAIDRSLNYLNKPSSQQYFPLGDITHKHAIDSLEAFAEMMDSRMTARSMNEAIRSRFDVYMSVGCDGAGTVLFTGYYTPIFDGSMKRTERFQYPLYKTPENLVKGPDGETLGMRGTAGVLAQYPSRAIIESTNMLAGTELIWMSDPFEVYIAHVQGSAKIRLPNNKLITVGYAANNGHEYHGISKELVNDGKLRTDQLSLSAMIDFFKNNPQLINTYVWRNPRFVFFKIQEGEPRGSLNEQVIPLRTIATDKSIFPRGCLTFISTRLPQETAGTVSNRFYSGFALDQDTGGAIRAPGRCDVYMGIGDSAGKLAGQTYQEGKLYYLFLKSTDTTFFPNR
ncbi:MAG: MltA domain-containing protein [Sedimentisphaerales bacterium]|nr:MltA domain-containing protein [Sedimentisphaerales bacterium]